MCRKRIYWWSCFHDIFSTYHFINLFIILLLNERYLPNVQKEEKGYRRLMPQQSVGLRHCGHVISVSEVVRTSSGEVDYLKVTCESATDANKPKAFIQWVAQPLKCEVRLYEKL